MRLSYTAFRIRAGSQVGYDGIGMKSFVAVAVLTLLASSASAWPRLPKPSSADAAAKLKGHLARLASSVDEERADAVRAIKEMGPAGTPAIPSLRSAFQESSPRTRALIASLLATFGPAAKEALPDLLEAVRQPRIDINLLTELAQAIAALGDPGNRDMVRACLAGQNLPRRQVVPLTDLMRQYPVMVPVVADHLTDTRTSVRSRAAQYLFRFLSTRDASKPASLSPEARERIRSRLLNAIEDPHHAVRSAAVAALIEIDPTTAPRTLPVIVTLMRQRDSDYEALGALRRIGPASARLLIDYLGDPEEHVRGSLVSALSDYRLDATPVLAAGLRHPNPRVREGVIQAIARSTSQTAAVRSDLLARLGDPDATVRLAAAITLANDPKTAGPAVPVLTEAAFSRNPQVRSRSLDVLAILKTTARPAVPDMLRRVRTGDLTTRFATAKVLAAADHSTWPTYVPVFVEVIRSTDHYERRVAAECLRDAGPDAKAALPALRTMLDDDEALNRVHAAEAIGCIAPNDAADAIACLVEEFYPADPDVRNRNTVRLMAIYALRKIGPPAKSAVPALLDLMRSLNNRFAVDAAVSAIKIDPANAREAYDGFRAHLRPAVAPDESWLDQIDELGKDAKPLLPDLIAALKSKHEVHRSTALKGLRNLGPDAAEALQVLREMAKDGKGNPRVEATIRAIEGKK